MKDAAPQRIHLADYRPPSHLVEDVHLTFQLDPKATRVTSRIRFKPNPDSEETGFRLHGEGLTLISAKIDGTRVDPEMVEDGLVVAAPNDAFTWEAVVEINPEDNKALEGLYLSNGMYCTQCEAQGFRRITYYPDRPDVMAPFTVRIESDLPVLLSNGNLKERGEGFTEWHDPWPKPAYLFALVAGELVDVHDTFITKSGREVQLAVWVRKGDEHKCGWALNSLKKSMKWDEDIYGREYDLDIFNIVAVDDFNMGAMENKGLNIFNASAVLCSPETSTDADFERIEAIVAHEYFHNWTGNRITCRDWFQLCLKEGLTVFRDQQFTADMRSAPVKRIEDAILLRARQFREDAGPLAHPVRPESFVEINNFYTVTVYEKGAELIGMLKRIVGDETYYKALDLYFERHDGDAATIEDWIKVFEDAADRDLSQFMLWYSQAGTPKITVTETFEEGTHTLVLEQSVPDTPGQADKKPMHIPLLFALFDPDTGQQFGEDVLLELTEPRIEIRTRGHDRKPVVSLNRDFSAPVIIDDTSRTDDRLFLLANETDSFNRWEAARSLTRDALTALATGGLGPGEEYLDALNGLLVDDSLDPAYRALILRQPSEEEIAQAIFDYGRHPEPLSVNRAADTLRARMAAHFEPDLPRLFRGMQVHGAYSPEAADAGRRAFANGLLTLLSRLDGGTAARAQFDQADNMTNRLAALGSLLQIDEGAEALARFESDWKHDRLVMNKWYAIQISLAPPEAAVGTARALTEREDFDWTNPNRFRAVMGGLVSNPAGFHDATGAGYEFLADWLIRLDEKNPQTAARTSTAFETWKRYDPKRQDLIKAQLDRILGTEGLSRDLTEMMTRIRGDDD
ncbi:aminopeptidase N [Aestuariibius sp. 2305UL40-4]|uniref:aminopeptidase N n=1 Tax=Aestuariibius violaceus TaxID=3234132 RepID=UPI00345E9DA5